MAPAGRPLCLEGCAIARDNGAGLIHAYGRSPQLCLGRPFAAKANSFVGIAYFGHLHADTNDALRYSPVVTALGVAPLAYAWNGEHHFMGVSDLLVSLRVIVSPQMTNLMIAWKWVPAKLG